MNSLIQKFEYNLESLVETTRDRTYLTNALAEVRDNARSGDYAEAINGLRRVEGWSEDLGDANTQALSQCLTQLEQLELEQQQSESKTREHWRYTLARLLLFALAAGSLALSIQVYHRISRSELGSGYYAAFAFCLVAAFALFYTSIWARREAVGRVINSLRI